ncbi:hypothetical protein [Geodermatophilus marinus]|uniref:hypothetical protein n=1 Tax=Geodermatophilus sp. LHW52908 TaxID=2303986 RepID=UPI000E3B878F|nr:hypothetical protein [Geodermatophilus sp. LHW52908]RFU22536.1 hypothetical protein D0Z06_04615 [Geodermatophilus sp. LHW52908]
MSEPPDWVEQARRLVAGLGRASGAGEHPADCRWCPVCQVAAVVRGERPEVAAALAGVLDAAAAALRSLAEPPAEPTAAGRASSPAASPAATPGATPGTTSRPAAAPAEPGVPPRPQSPPVQHIEIA